MVAQASVISMNWSANETKLGKVRTGDSVSFCFNWVKADCHASSQVNTAPLVVCTYVGIMVLQYQQNDEYISANMKQGLKSCAIHWH